MMHDVIQNGLEDYLTGDVRRDFQAHLDQCGECRRQVSEFSAMSGIFGLLKESPIEAEQAVTPEPGFYYRLSQNIEARRAASPWSLFSINAAFGRRVAFGSLMTLALLGGFLISRESDMSADQQPAPETIMASHDGTAPHEAGSDRDRMMLTLASYNR